jgi:hypothetical protein
MTVKDWAELVVTLLAIIGWFQSYYRHSALKQELRGVKGYKFRAMWREYADDHNIPTNGEDTD